MDLFTALQNYKMTENGALTYASSGSRVLDLFGQGGALRKRDTSEIEDLVKKSFEEDPLRTIETLLYLRDIRGGQGEKRVFQVGIKALLNEIKPLGGLNNLFDAIIEVGSWKDIFTCFSIEEYGPYLKKTIEILKQDN